MTASARTCRDRTAPAAADLTIFVKREARQLGFAQVGICPAVTPQGISRFTGWLEAGYAGEMRYLADRAPAYEHPRHVLDGARSLIMLTVPYRTSDPQPARKGEGRIARYAWGTDYHDQLRDRLAKLADCIRQAAPAASLRGVVDTAPLLEREFARMAHLGWIGKNSLLLNREAGSYFFLAALLTDLVLDYDTPFDEDHCGNCRACLDACPTGAFVAPYVLDSRRCISYLTIELRGPIPPELRPGIGDWLFGCDICQEVCPWNDRAAQSIDAAYQPRPGSNPVELAALFSLSDEEFRVRFRDTPLWRARRRGILRNAATILGNQRAESAVPALARGIADQEPLVRGASAWALGQIRSSAARALLAQRQKSEADPQVHEEIELALLYT